MKHLQHIKILLLRLSVLLVLYSLFRVAFYLVNASLFPTLSPFELVKACFYGIRFDLSAILYLNALFVLLHLIPISHRGYPTYQKVVKFVFYTFNFVGLFFIIADFEYFQYGMKRSDSQAFSYAFDFFNLSWQMLFDFWHWILTAILLVIFIEWLYRKTTPNSFYKMDTFLPHFALFFVGLGLMVIGLRGGLQLRPIKPITAAKYVEPALIPLVINSPFNIIHTLTRKGVEVPAYFPDNQLDDIYPIYHSAYSSKPDAMNKENVVVIIMESLSRNFTSLSGKESYTPFLDSLMQHSLVCTNTFANGKQSNQGIPAITASIPALMQEPYITSTYQSNKLAGLGTLLKKTGYQTAFFHGANNGSFNLDVYAHAAGFEHFYGRNEYNNDEEFDGNWGIFDDAFFRFTANELSTFKQPFGAVLFSLSAHYPFALPEVYENQFKKGPIPMHELNGYADHSLKLFFETASKQDWFEKTLFVICADHTGPAVTEYDVNRIGLYAIPLVFYKADGSLAGKRVEFVTQQTDIMPSILDCLDYPFPFTAFGSSIFDTTATNRYSFTYINELYQIANDRYALHFDGNAVQGLYDYKLDSLMKNDLLMTERNGEVRALENTLKGVIQQHHKVMKENKLVMESN